MLPHWFDFHALQVSVGVLAVVLGVSAVLILSLARPAVVRFGLALLCVAGVVGLVVYAQGPLHKAEQTCHYRFLKSDLRLDGCVHANAAVKK